MPRTLADYGRLYNWYAVDDARSLCPSGWHVPTDGEYMILEMALGMSESEANYRRARHRPRDADEVLSHQTILRGTAQTRAVFLHCRAAIDGTTLVTSTKEVTTAGISGRLPQIPQMAPTLGPGN